MSQSLKMDVNLSWANILHHGGFPCHCHCILCLCHIMIPALHGFKLNGGFVQWHQLVARGNSTTWGLLFDSQRSALSASTIANQQPADCTQWSGLRLMGLMNGDQWCIFLYSLFVMASGRPWATSLFTFRYGCNKEYSRWQSSVRIIWNVIGQWKTSWQYRRGTHLRPVSLRSFSIDSAENPQSVSAYCSSLSDHRCPIRVGALFFIISWCYIFMWHFFSSTISAWRSSLLIWLSSQPPTGVHCRLVTSTLTLDQQFEDSS